MLLGSIVGAPDFWKLPNAPVTLTGVFQRLGVHSSVVGIQDADPDLPHLFVMGSRARFDEKWDSMPSIGEDVSPAATSTPVRSRAILFEDAHVSTLTSIVFEQ